MSAEEAITKPISSVLGEAGSSTTKLEAPIPQGLDTPENGYWEQLVHHTFNITEDRLLYPEFDRLQHLNIVHLHNTLAEIMADIWQTKTTSKGQVADLKTAIHDYGIKLSTKEQPRQIVTNIVKLRQSRTENT
jgi:hypothetical protein